MASRNLGTLTIDLVAQVAGFIAGMSQASRATEENMRKIEQTITGSVDLIKTTFATLGVYEVFKHVIGATVAQEEAFAKLNQTVIATGGAAGKTTDDLVAL